MNDQIRTVILQAPITIKIGPVPDNIQSHSQIITFALSNLQRLAKERGLPVEIDGKHAVASYLDEGALSSFTIGGRRLDDRHYRVQPADGKHALELSDDKGLSFVQIATFEDHDVADSFGQSWVSGRAEKVQA